MSAAAGDLEAFRARMAAAGAPDIAIHTFQHYYHLLREGKTGLIPETDLVDIGGLPDAETFTPALAETGRRALPKTVLLKLNGGLGTSMGLEQAKSLLVVKNGLTFLDVIAQQALHCEIPLLLMNSFMTHEDSLAALRRYPGLWGDMPLDFVQHMFPKINRADLRPAESPANPDLAWYPPGHGDIYTTLVTSGTLDTLLDAGYAYAFVSNADNLGAVVATEILGYFVDQNLPFMMEVADRTAVDRKGGHLARLADGQLILRESAQCPPDDSAAFQDITRHRYFNTNNLWLNLPALKEQLAAHDYVLGLPMIVNPKTVDPRDPDSMPIYQLETAMGSAIAVFEGARAVRVPRARFAPVKTTDDLLAVRSDAYVLTEDYRVAPNPARRLGPPAVNLDPAYYRLIDDMEARFPYGPPGMVDCASLMVQGDVHFGRRVQLVGQVALVNPTDRPGYIADGRVIRDETVTVESEGDA
jgi:UTP--glucose-1-phosphate uridylyltransferase